MTTLAECPLEPTEQMVDHSIDAYNAVIAHAADNRAMVTSSDRREAMRSALQAMLQHMRSTK